MEARVVSRLFHTDQYEIKNWSLNFDGNVEWKKEFNDCFCLVFVRKGNLAKAAYEVTSGHATIERPNFEYQLLASKGQCTIVNFSDDLYARLQEDIGLKKIFKVSGKDILTRIVKSCPDSEYLLFNMLQQRKFEKLATDNLVFDLLNNALRSTPLGQSIKVNKYHRDAVEAAKEYINHSFSRELSLFELADHCGVSAFYFSRIFKSYTQYSPHQYLLNVRLKHGEMLLRNTEQSIADITYSSGFSSPEHFSTAFKRKFKATPTKYRSAKL